MDFCRLFCLSHPQQLITNYCNKQQCQTGLCANCICIHTQMHMSRGSSPVYQNIRSTYKNINELIRNQIKQLQSISRRIVGIEGKIQQKRQKLSAIFNEVRRQTFQTISGFFQYKEKELLRELEAQEQKFGLHSKFRMQSLKKNIEKQIDSLSSNLQNLQVKNFLQHMPKLKIQIIPNSKNLIQQLSAQVVENQKFSLSINYNKKVIEQVCKQLNKIIILSVGKDNLQTIQPLPFYNQNLIVKPKQKQKNQLNNLAKQKIKLFTLRRPSSQESLETVKYHNERQQQNFLSYNGQQNLLLGYESSQSKTTISNKPSQQKISPIHSVLKQNSIFQKLIDSQKNIQKKPLNRNDSNKLQETRRKYDFTFGKQFGQPQKPSQKHSDFNIINIQNSHISEKIRPTNNEKSFNPCFVSNAQQKQINNNIRKMEKKSEKFSQYLQKYNDKQKDREIDKESSLNSSLNVSQYMYRTQIL